MCYQYRCDTLDKNPVLVARHFQYRVEFFFKEIVLNDPLGKTKYYAILVEFQVKGSPHIYSFIWILNAPKLNIELKGEYNQYGFIALYVQRCLTLSKRNRCLNWLRHFNFIDIQRHAENIATGSVGSTLKDSFHIGQL